MVVRLPELRADASCGFVAPSEPRPTLAIIPWCRTTAPCSQLVVPEFESIDAFGPKPLFRVDRRPDRPQNRSKNEIEWAGIPLSRPGS